MANLIPSAMMDFIDKIYNSTSSKVYQCGPAGSDAM